MGWFDRCSNWTERRKQARHRVIITAWLRTNDSVPHVCVLWDVSEGGARLSVTDITALPPQFTLVLEREAVTGTTCQVVWRSPDQIGIKFVEKADPALHDLIRQKSRLVARTSAAQARLTDQR